LTSAATAADRIRSRLGQRQGASLLRLGDGEGALLSHAANPDPRLDAYLATHFGPGVAGTRLHALAERLGSAIGAADLIGIREDVQAREFPIAPLDVSPQSLVDWAGLHLALRSEERDSLDQESALRLVLLGRWMANFAWPPDALLVSAWIHFDWLESGFLADLAATEAHIGLVTGRSELAPVFRAAGVEVDEWKVPFRHLRRDDAWTPHFPDRYDELLETLNPAFPGQLFFVGAGICGKIYCDVIARRGGVAIDIGAVCDAWLGISTRPRVSRSRWGQDTVPRHLLLRRQLEARAVSGRPRSHGAP
jgi:hypothetical protein